MWEGIYVVEMPLAGQLVLSSGENKLTVASGHGSYASGIQGGGVNDRLSGVEGRKILASQGSCGVVYG